MSETKKYKYQEYLEVGFKNCVDCGHQPIDKFTLEKPSKNKKIPSFKSRCTSCATKRKTLTDIIKYGSIRNKDLKRKYGLTSEQYNIMSEEQNGLCAICNSNKGTHVDHCHVSGKVRGLLCNQCNASIGGLGDNPQTILAAFKYVVNGGVKYKNHVN